MTEVASLYAVLKADTSDLQSGLRTAKTELEKTADGIRDLSKTTESSARAQAEFARSSTPVYDFFKNVQGQILPATAILGTFAAALKATWEAGMQGAQVAQTTASFRTMLEVIGAAPDLLAQLRLAARGTVDDMTLMSSVQLLLAGTSGDLANEFANATPRLLEMAAAAQKINPSLGDTEFLFDSIARGIKRSSPLILDNLGIVVKLGPAYDEYARSLGKSADALSAEEKQIALLNAVLGEYDTLIAQAGGSTEAAGDQMARAAARAKNAWDDFISKTWYPFWNNVATTVNFMGDVNDLLNRHEEQVRATEFSYAAYTQEVMRARVAAGELSQSWVNMHGAAVAQGEASENLVRSLGLVTREEWNAKRAAEANAETQAVLAEGWRAAAAAAYDAGPALEAWTARLQGQADALGVSTKANFEWISSTERAAAAQAELAGRYADLKTILSGELGQANRDFAASQAAIRDRTLEVLAELEKYRGLHGVTVTAVTDTAEAQRNLTIAMYDAQVAGQRLAEAQAALAANTDPEKQLQLEAAVARAQGAFNGAKGKVEEWNTSLDESANTYVTNYSSKLDELEGELNDLQTEYDANAAAHQDMVKRIVFGMLEQRLAADGWQAGELEMLAGIGQAWGLYDQDTATALANVDAALLASQGNADTFLAYMNRVMGLPDKTVTITTKYVYHGYQPGDPNDPTNYLPPPDVTGPIPMAEGGAGVVTRPTWFLAGEAGPEAFQFMPLGGGGAAGGGGGVWNGDINLYAGDPREAARAVIEVLQDRGIIAKTLLR